MTETDQKRVKNIAHTLSELIRDQDYLGNPISTELVWDDDLACRMVARHGNTELFSICVELTQQPSILGVVLSKIQYTVSTLQVTNDYPNLPDGYDYIDHLTTTNAAAAIGNAIGLVIQSELEAQWDAEMESAMAAQCKLYAQQP